jgi:hypothetical protein
MLGSYYFIEKFVSFCDCDSTQTQYYLVPVHEMSQDYIASVGGLCDYEGEFEKYEYDDVDAIFWLLPHIVKSFWFEQYNCC